ncbi:hypothetical protein BVY00_01080 [bacterium G20]|nr:hypothetical protein BVY00_01080 [bacterium G20]
MSTAEDPKFEPYDSARRHPHAWGSHPVVPYPEAQVAHWNATYANNPVIRTAAQALIAQQRDNEHAHFDEIPQERIINGN